MKLKSRPEDFEVEELADFPLGDGPFAVYLLTKRSLGTPEAVTAIQQRWKLKRQQIGYGGLKDKHAITRQWITIFHGPRRNLEQTHVHLVYQGQAARSFTPQDIVGNRFVITLRGLAEDQARQMVSATAVVQRDGVPNYFDDQRFGSLGHAGEFVAQPWCRGDYERALWLALADPNPHDRPRDRETKRILREHWGRWAACKAALPKSSCRSIVSFLCDHPADFRRALALIRQDLRSLYLAAFQSHLWNQILADLLAAELPPAERCLVSLETGTVPFFRSLDDTQRWHLHQLNLPLPSARLHFAADDPLRQRYERIVQAAGLSLRELRVKYPRDSFFSKGERAAVVVPRRLSAAIVPDEFHPGHAAIRLEFTLPRGAYATLVVKRLGLG
jgi:tRNA pseudouridine13 synthase